MTGRWLFLTFGGICCQIGVEGQRRTVGNGAGDVWTAEFVRIELPSITKEKNENADAMKSCDEGCEA